MRVTSDGFISLMMKGDGRQEGGDRDRAREAAGEQKKAREMCETPQRGVGDRPAQ